MFYATRFGEGLSNSDIAREAAVAARAAPTYRDLPATPARIRKHLDFAVGWLEQARLDREAGADGFADHALLKRRQHQQALADIRGGRS